MPTPDSRPTLRVHVNGKPATHTPRVGDTVTFPDYPAYQPRRITSASTATRDGINWTSHLLATIETPATTTTATPGPDEQAA